MTLLKQKILTCWIFSFYNRSEKMWLVSRDVMATFIELICRKDNIQKQFRVIVDICIQEWCDITQFILLFITFEKMWHRNCHIFWHPSISSGKQVKIHGFKFFSSLYTKQGEPSIRLTYSCQLAKWKRHVSHLKKSKKSGTVIACHLIIIFHEMFKLLITLHSE